MSETPQTAKQQAQAGGTRVPEQTRGEGRVTAPQTASGQRGETQPPASTAWAGWAIFASMMMVMVGAFQVIVGLTALLNSSYYVARNGLLINVNYAAWGWVHLVLGAVAVAAGFGLLAGRMWARVVGIAMALVSAVVNLAFMAAYPLWSTTVIALDVVVIYAIAMHGKEIQSEGR
jgi:hypothetical protein